MVGTERDRLVDIYRENDREKKAKERDNVEERERKMTIVNIMIGKEKRSIENHNVERVKRNKF